MSEKRRSKRYDLFHAEKLDQVLRMCIYTKVSSQTL